MSRAKVSFHATHTYTQNSSFRNTITVFPLINAPAFIISSSFCPRRLKETRRLLEARRLLFRDESRPQFFENFSLKWLKVGNSVPNLDALAYISQIGA